MQDVLRVWFNSDRSNLVLCKTRTAQRTQTNIMLHRIIHFLVLSAVFLVWESMQITLILLFFLSRCLYRWFLNFQMLFSHVLQFCSDLLNVLVFELSRHFCDCGLDKIGKERNLKESGEEAGQPPLRWPRSTRKSVEITLSHFHESTAATAAAAAASTPLSSLSDPCPWNLACNKRRSANEWRCLFK